MTGHYWFGTRSQAGLSRAGGSSDSETGDRTADVQRNESLPLQRLWLRSLSLCIVAGSVVVLIFAVQSPNSSLGVASLLAGACLLVGGLLGFLFGVPRSARGIDHSTGKPEGAKGATVDPATTDGDASEYRPNTNLEEVSDWLTKILVGVGLTQLINAPAKAVAFGTYFGPALGGGAVGERFAICVLL